MKEIIYEKYYPGRIETPPKPVEFKEISEEDRKEAMEFLQKLETSLVRVSIPNREKQSQKFIKAAIGVSEMYSLDLCLERHVDHISATLSFDDGGGMSALQPVFSMGDDFAFFSHLYGRIHTVSIDFYTHALYRNGRLIAPVHWDFGE